jgi:hypothetical protein
MHMCATTLTRFRFCGWLPHRPVECENFHRSQKADDRVKFFQVVESPLLRCAVSPCELYVQAGVGRSPEKRRVRAMGMSRQRLGCGEPKASEALLGQGIAGQGSSAGHLNAVGSVISHREHCAVAGLVMTVPRLVIATDTVLWSGLQRAFGTHTRCAEMFAKHSHTFSGARSLGLCSPGTPVRRRCKPAIGRRCPPPKSLRVPLRLLLPATACCSCLLLPGGAVGCVP